MTRDQWTVSIVRKNGNLTDRMDCKWANFNFQEHHVGCVEYDSFSMALGFSIWLVGIATIILAAFILVMLMLKWMGRVELKPFTVEPGIGLVTIAGWPFAIIAASCIDAILS